MPKVRTHYDNLKVARDAPIEVIRAAYRTLAAKYHPDHNPGNARCARVSQILNTSYEVLADPIARKQHDEWIARSESESTYRPPEPSPQRPYQPSEPSRPPVHKETRQPDRNPMRIPVVIILAVVVSGVILSLVENDSKERPRPRRDAVSYADGTHQRLWFLFHSRRVARQDVCRKRWCRTVHNHNGASSSSHL